MPVTYVHYVLREMLGFLKIKKLLIKNTNTSTFINMSCIVFCTGRHHIVLKEEIKRFMIVFLLLFGRYIVYVFIHFETDLYKSKTLMYSGILYVSLEDIQQAGIPQILRKTLKYFNIFFLLPLLAYFL